VVTAPLSSSATKVDLLADGAGAQVGADRGGTRPRDHEHCHQRAQLGDGTDRRTSPGDVGGAELGEQDVQQEDQQHGQRG
jgi:hypothetical protein